MAPPAQIHVIYCLDGDHDPLGWYAVGHLSDEEFTAALKRHTPIWPQWEDVPRLGREPIQRSWWRKVPSRFGEMRFYAALPGSRGAFAVTYLASSNMELF